MNREKVDKVVAKIRHLQFVTSSTGFITTKSQGEPLRNLNVEELALAGELLNKKSTERLTDEETY